MTVLAELRSNCDEVNGCWLWRGSLRSGYAQVSSRYETRSGHRLAYIEMKGPIPEGLQLDHLCRNRSCINPDHLEPVTIAENIRRSPIVGRAKKPIAGILSRERAAARIHCRNGHLIAENVIYTAGRRRCRACDHRATAAYRARQRGLAA